MSLQKKILLGFLVSAACIAALAAVLFESFVAIKKETLFLEETDSVRSKSLQLRRHEKNFLLYAPEGAPAEVAAIRDYLGQIERLVGGMHGGRSPRTAVLGTLVARYRTELEEVLALFAEAMRASAGLAAAAPSYRQVRELAESNFLSQPLADARYLRREARLAPDHTFVATLGRLDGAITALRHTGESILTESKELDKIARANVDRFIDRSRAALLLLAPASLALGLGTLLVVTAGVVRRLRLLAEVVERAGSGQFLPAPGGGTDEVGSLIRKFNLMEERLAERERELLRSRNLAAIGTFASGVAHELNNPLSNISTTAQRLLRRSGPDLPEGIRRGLDDIRGQTLRVKNIVGDLLEFARGRAPRHAAVELVALARAAWEHLGATRDLARVGFEVRAEPPEIVLEADPEQLERVFINLFANAVDAMREGGLLVVGARELDGRVFVQVSDSGAGIAPEALERLFEPFYTTKDRGTGLGLAIVATIVEKHRGRINVESTPGVGTAFALELPLRAAAGGGGTA